MSGEGEITIGQLPDNITDSNITWVPVRLYAPSEGGLTPPTFSPNEVYPLYVMFFMSKAFLLIRDDLQALGGAN